MSVQAWKPERCCAVLGTICRPLITAGPLGSVGCPHCLRWFIRRCILCSNRDGKECIVPSSKNRRRVEIPDWLYLTIEWIARAEGRTVSDTTERLLFEGILRLYSRGD